MPIYPINDIIGWLVDLTDIEGIYLRINVSQEEKKMSFAEVKCFQVKPEKLNEFQSLVKEMLPMQKERSGCLDIKYMKRFYIFDKIGDLPRPLTKIVKCVKYYSYWQFDSINNYSDATGWFFAEYEKQLSKLLIMPFDIMCGESLDV